MNKDLEKLYIAIVYCHNQVYMGIKDIQPTSMTLEQLADTSFVCRESLRYLEEIRKEVTRLQRLADRVACLKWTQLEELDPIRTEYCTATPEVRSGPTLPKVGSPEYDKLMDWIGIPEDKRALVRPSFSGLRNLISRYLDEAKPLPEVLNGQLVDDFKLRIFKKKDILNG